MDSTTPPVFEPLKIMVEDRLATLVPEMGGPSEAARHSLLAPAKRVRAVLTLIACLDGGGTAEDALDSACAIEMIHTASLIFDDLPAMDDADMRRDVVTPHVLYGVDVAILAGIGLLNGAYGVVAADRRLGAEDKVAVSNILADAVGWTGLVRGQALDLTSADNDAAIETIHHAKTGVLFTSAVRVGIIAAHADPEREAALLTYAEALGRAFQVLDDALDQGASSAVSGKTAGRDRDKRTALTDTDSAQAIAEAVETANRAIAEAKEAVASAADASAHPLCLFADHIFARFKKMLSAD